MALRRPPTRVELKTEDIEEYHEVRFLLSIGKDGTVALPVRPLFHFISTHLFDVLAWGDRSFLTWY